MDTTTVDETTTGIVMEIFHTLVESGIVGCNNYETLEEMTRKEIPEELASGSDCIIESVRTQAEAFWKQEE